MNKLINKCDTWFIFHPFQNNSFTLYTILPITLLLQENLEILTKQTSKLQANDT